MNIEYIIMDLYYFCFQVRQVSYLLKKHEMKKMKPLEKENVCRRREGDGQSPIRAPQNPEKMRLGQVEA